jgi:protein SCO1
MTTELATTGAQSEKQFAALVDELAACADRREQLTDLLRESHPLYDQRGTAATVRMRGWILLALARVGVSDAQLLYVLEELDTGADAYLVAAAARALRSYARPTAAFAPFVMRAINNIRYHDEPVSLDSYGEYAVRSTGTTTTPVRELLATLSWLGPQARAVLHEVEALGAQRGRLSRKVLLDLDRTVAAIRGGRQAGQSDIDSCCRLPGGLGDALSWARRARRGAEPIEATVFEDHDGAPITFKELFHGHPSIVVFFYTRCDNPLKCSLTVTKLARIHKLLAEQSLSEQIHTAAISYDPAFDLPERLRGYGEARGVQLDSRHRMLRATDGMEAMREHFGLGVNFIESLVNRHRLEVYVLDAEGRIAGSFERIHWNEQQVVDRAIEVLNEGRNEGVKKEEQQDRPATIPPASSLLGTLAALGVAFFPKCPVCWAAYLSVFGIAGLERLEYTPWLQPVLVIVMLMNLATVWLRSRATGRLSGLLLVCAGAIAILASKTTLAWDSAALCGVALTSVGSVMSALGTANGRPMLLARLTSRA